MAVETMPVLQQDLIGNVRRGPAGKTRFSNLGVKALVQNAKVDLWEGPTAAYVFPAAAQQMAVVSSSASDAAAGTGIQIVRIHYLDSDYNEQVENVTLNGVTPVLTTGLNILRINGMHAYAVGSTGDAVGNISLTNSGGTVTYGYIAATYTMSRQAIYTVPAGKYGYITHWQNSSGSTGTHFCRVSLRATTHDGVLLPGVFLAHDESATQNAAVEISFEIPLAMPPKTDVKLTAISDAANANVTAIGSFIGWIE